MKNIMLFLVLIGLGVAGGSIFPDAMADAENSKAEESCNCGCGPTEVKVMMVPTGSDMLLTTSLIEAISNDSDNTLTQEELVTIINKIQKEYPQTIEQSAVKGVSTGTSENGTNTPASSYEEIINRFLSGNLTTTNETIIEKSGTVSGTSSIILNEEKTESTTTKKTKNNNGLGNGSEPADGTSSDVKGIDPSNPGNGQKNSNTSSKSEVKSSATTSEKMKVSKSKDKSKETKEKNNNGLGNGSEPADGTSTDIKGIDPSNPGNGGSKNNAGNK